MEKILDLKKVNISEKMQVVEYMAIAILIFLIPMLIPKIIAGTVLESYSQYIVGSIVNVALIVTAINLDGYKKVLSIITLPSISAIGSGLILKTAGIHTVYMIPFIWIGNFLLVALYKELYLGKKKNYIIASALAIVSKVAVIFFGYNVLVWTSVIKLPKLVQMLKIAMGTNQLITATIGAILAYVVCKLLYKEKIKE